MWSINRKGCTRIVILTKRHAVKFPNLLNYRMALYGLLANEQEKTMSRYRWPELCPVLFGLPLGLLIVMPRVKEMTDQEFLDFDAEGFTVKKDYIVTAELKADSFGWLNGQVVAIDYGT